MEIYIVPTLLIVAILGGHVLQIVFQREDWPFSDYRMYARPIRPDAATSLVLTAVFEDGTSESLTMTPLHPLLEPLNRMEAVGPLGRACARRGDTSKPLSDLIGWIRYRGQDAPSRRPRYLTIDWCVFFRIPPVVSRGHAPDKTILIHKADLAL